MIYPKWREIVFFIVLILVGGVMSKPRSFIVEVRADIPFQKEAVLISRDNPNLDYKIPYSQLFLTYQIVDRIGVKNAETIKKLIRCESNGENVSRPDSDGYLSRGILQFHDGPTGMETWNEMSADAGIKGSPENMIDSIKVADWMISNGKIGRWSCYYILKRKRVL